MRVADWEKRLHNYMLSVAAMKHKLSIPHEPDDWHCGMFCIGAIEAISGNRVYPNAIYNRSIWEAITASQTAFDGYVDGLAGYYGLKKIKPEMAHTGDILMLKWNADFGFRAMGVNVEKGVAIPAERGLRYAPISVAEIGYAI